MTFENKLVAMINKDIETGVAMNAMAHMILGLGAQFDNNALRLNDYQDQDGHIYPNISQIPFIILRGKSSDIKKVTTKAREEKIHYGVFTNTMTGDTYQEQLNRTLITPEDQLIFYSVVLFGPWEKVSEITKKYSLYK